MNRRHAFFRHANCMYCMRAPRSGARRPPGLRQLPDIQIFMVGEQVTVRVWRAAPRVWPPDRHRGDDAITRQYDAIERAEREMVVHSFYTLTILRGYEFAPPFLNNRSDPDDYVVIQACANQSRVVCFIASFTVPLSAARWTSVSCVTLFLCSRALSQGGRRGHAVRYLLRPVTLPGCCAAHAVRSQWPRQSS